MDLNKYKEWCSEHKKELLIAGVGTVTLGACAFFGIRRLNANAISETVMNTVVIPEAEISLGHKNYADTLPFEVNSHIRKLPDGMKASPLKQATALEKGYVLGPQETWVDSYTKCRVA